MARISARKIENSENETGNLFSKFSDKAIKHRKKNPSPREKFKADLLKNLNSLKSWNGEDKVRGAWFAKGADGIKLKIGGLEIEGDNSWTVDTIDNVKLMLNAVLELLERDDASVVVQIDAKSDIKRRKKADA